MEGKESCIRTNEFENQSKWAPEEYEITAEGFPDPVHEAVSVSPLENYPSLAPAPAFYFVFENKTKSKSREHTQQ